MTKMDTPWGKAEHVKEVAPGLLFVSTPSHGGFHLDEEHCQQLRKALPFFYAFGAGPDLHWMEEDCDWAAVALIWPELFTQDEVRQAVDTALHGRYWQEFRAWLNSLPGAAVLAIYNAHCERTGDMFRRGSEWTNGKGYTVTARRKRDGKHMAFNLSTYTVQPAWYTEAELLALGAWEVTL